MGLPSVVSESEWRTERAKLLVKEKELTRAMDALNAERRRLPMVAIDKEYVFDGPNGSSTLLDLFAGRRQLIVYHFMMSPGSDHRCPGCSLVADNVGHLAHLHARDTTLVFTSPAPLAQLVQYRERMGWSVPWYSVERSDFSADMGAPVYHGFSVFLRDGDQVFRTYFTDGRGGDMLIGTLRYLDLTPLGRQEAWEEPSGRGTDGPGHWWRVHDTYR
ncbi:DUF899 domain-containing protein [Pseudonocardia spinosispora]|uniref:DUF899 domain-containing protein n=1 Tax=Pseudonocardia spinosispora TaxID=103441 RepID=UPI0004167119|nr:DUF899 domain-containing protein [Pseudonocardia spinosispora]